MKLFTKEFNELSIKDQVLAIANSVKIYIDHKVSRFRSRDTKGKAIRVAFFTLAMLMVILQPLTLLAYPNLSVVLNLFIAFIFYDLAV